MHNVPIATLKTDTRNNIINISILVTPNSILVNNSSAISVIIFCILNAVRLPSIFAK